MSKDPAFLFYPKDWIEGTAEFTLEQKGAYIDLLSFQHQRTFLPNDTSKLARMLGLPLSDFLLIWDALSCKFPESESGKLANQKLSKMSSDRSEYSVMRRINGTFGAIMRSLNLPFYQAEKVKKHFKYEDFVHVPTQELSNLLGKWIAKTKQMIENENGNAIINGDSIGGMGEKKGEVDWGEEKKKFISDTVWHEVVQKLYKIDESTFKALASKFLKKVESAQNFMCLKELKKYFCNWYDKILENQKIA